MSKQSELLAHLQTGASITTKQISGFFGLKNPHDAIYNLRNEGYCVYGNSTVLKSGVTTTKYRIGTPSRSMVAAVARTTGSTLFARS